MRVDGASADKDGKLLCLIRHGQGKHNPRADLRFLWHLTQGADPELTDKGKQQAAALRSRLLASLPTKPEAVVVSPLSRAIQTCDAMFGDDLALPKVLCPLITERCCSQADVGTPASALKARRPECSAWAGLDELEEQWWPTRTLSHDEFWPLERVAKAKAWLLARDERCLAVVGHKGVFQCLTAGADMPNGYRLGNCEALWVRLKGDGTVERVGRT